MAVVYKIKNWEANFENNRTRELKQMAWVPIPNSLDGDGYTELMDDRNGAAHFAAFIVMVEIASKCDPRGTLLRGTKKPHDAASLSRISRIPACIFDEAIPRLINIGWVEAVSLDADEVVSIPQAPATIPHLPATAPQEPALNGREGKEGNGMEEKESESAVADFPPPELGRLIDAWNELPQGIAPRVVKRDSKGIRSGWKRVQRERDIRRLFDVPGPIMAKIRGSPFTHNQSWFTFDWLFCTGKSGEWNIVKLMRGNYEGNGRLPPESDLADRKRERLARLRANHDP